MITLEEATRYREELSEVLREDAHNEERILKRLDQIRTQSGLQVYAALLLILTNLGFEESEARRHWEEVLKHRRALGHSLGELQAVGKLRARGQPAIVRHDRDVVALVHLDVERFGFGYVIHDSNPDAIRIPRQRAPARTTRAETDTKSYALPVRTICETGPSASLLALS